MFFCRGNIFGGRFGFFKYYREEVGAVVLIAGAGWDIGCWDAGWLGYWMVGFGLFFEFYVLELGFWVVCGFKFIYILYIFVYVCGVLYSEVVWLIVFWELEFF